MPYEETSMMVVQGYAMVGSLDYLSAVVHHLVLDLGDLANHALGVWMGNHYWWRAEPMVAEFQYSQ